MMREQILTRLHDGELMLLAVVASGTGLRSAINLELERRSLMREGRQRAVERLDEIELEERVALEAL